MNIRTRLASLLPLFAAALLPPTHTRAQSPDPTEEIKELARRIDEEMAEIDRLLLESAKSSGETPGKPADKLRSTKERSETVEQNIDELIQKLEEMKNQGGGGGGGGQPQDQQQQQGQQDGQQQQGQQNPQGQQGQQQNRREGSNPDFVDQNKPQGQQEGQQEGQQNQQGQQPQDQQGQPLGGEVNPEGGENRPPNQLQENATGPGQRGEGEGSWGDLQPYTNFLKNRGTTPEVPERYRKYWKAYLEAQRKKNSGR